MAKTLLQVREQIARLQMDEERLRRAEAAEVIGKIKLAIDAYRLTPADLFGIASSVGNESDVIVGAARTEVKSRRRADSSSPKTKVAGKTKSTLIAKPQFADGQGNEWVGRGPRPAWLREALASGKALLDFAVTRDARKKAKTVGSGDRKVAQNGSAAALAQKPTVAIKYRDGENQWSGRGSQPRWLRTALEGGKSLQDFAV
jgi:DNA-binding protein H-NS